eukprot:TRINITY_DN12266_c0_g4_i2.p2 TRINITY_DN12266_c0_g4~~TRINITY_DN12266_c0_g4_i2.p2  ORF type:complete len:193 (+),score=6.06 TRINITY_DN12266_c0_g4_i2:126-704(+)
MKILSYLSVLCMIYLTEGIFWFPILAQTSEVIYFKGASFFFPWVTYTTTKISIPYLTMLPRMEDPGIFYLESCEDIIDGDCGHMDDFQQCGFCMESSYPLKGYGVTLSQGFNETACPGIVLDSGTQCPMPIDCNAVLTCMLECGNQERISGQIVEVPDTCKNKCNSDQSVLTACRLFTDNNNVQSTYSTATI